MLLLTTSFLGYPLPRSHRHGGFEKKNVSIQKLFLSFPNKGGCSYMNIYIYIHELWVRIPKCKTWKRHVSHVPFILDIPICFTTSASEHGESARLWTVCGPRFKAAKPVAKSPPNVMPTPRWNTTCLDSGSGWQKIVTCWSNTMQFTTCLIEIKCIYYI